MLSGGSLALNLPTLGGLIARVLHIAVAAEVHPDQADRDRAEQQHEAAGSDPGQVERDAEQHRQQEAAQAASAGQALWLASRPFILSAAALLALWLAGRQALRRCGWQRLRLAALALWLLLWLAAAAWLVASHLNRTGRSAQPAQTAQVLLVREIAPTSRGPGGAEVYVQTGPGAPALRVLAEGRAMSDFPQNSAVTLRPWRGRWWGRWATVERAGEN